MRRPEIEDHPPVFPEADPTKLSAYPLRLQNSHPPETDHVPCPASAPVSREPDGSIRQKKSIEGNRGEGNNQHHLGNRETGACSSGVLGIGCRILIGTYRIPSPRSSSTISTLSFIDSPIPKIPPLHTSSPARCATLTTASLLSYVWIVHICRKYLREVSRFA